MNPIQIGGAAPVAVTTEAGVKPQQPAREPRKFARRPGCPCAMCRAVVSGPPSPRPSQPTLAARVERLEKLMAHLLKIKKE